MLDILISKNKSPKLSQVFLITLYVLLNCPHPFTSWHRHTSKHPILTLRRATKKTIKAWDMIVHNKSAFIKLMIKLFYSAVLPNILHSFHYNSCVLCCNIRFHQAEVGRCFKASLGERPLIYIKCLDFWTFVVVVYGILYMWPSTTKGTWCLLLRKLRFVHYLTGELTSFPMIPNS